MPRIRIKKTPCADCDKKAQYGGRMRNTGLGNYNPHLYPFKHNPQVYKEPIKETPEITGTIKSVPREDANIETEAGEILMRPGGEGLYKIKGKKHSQGGTPIFAEGGSFIFSNDPDLHIDKEERDIFDFKDSSVKGKKANTPAKVLEREVKPKDYNKMIAILKDKNSDNIARTTAQLMLDKYNTRLGRVAFIQEAKKGAKIPDFAYGTAPVKRPEIQQQEDLQENYSYGGTYQGGGGFEEDLDKMYTLLGKKPKKNTNKGIWPGDVFPTIDPLTGKISNKWNAMTDYKDIYDYAKAVGYTGQIDPKNFKKSALQIQQYVMSNYPDLVDEYHQPPPSGYGMPYAGKPDDEKLGVRWHDIAKNIGLRNKLVPTKVQGPTSIDYTRGDINVPPYDISPEPKESVPSLPYDIKGKLSSSQLAHLGWIGLQSMNINRYYPKRGQVSLPEVNLNEINPQPYINQINNQTRQAYQVSDNPAYASNIYGKGLDAISSTLGNISNQNVQIRNQENLTNLGQRTQQVMANNQLDQQYYDQVNMTNENFDRERRFAQNQFASTLNKYQSDADNLAWMLASTNKYGKRRVVDPKTGRSYDQPVPLYEYTGRGIRYNADVADLYMATGADRINSIQEMAKSIKTLTDLGLDSRSAAYIIGNMLKSKQTTYMNNPSIQ